MRSYNVRKCPFNQQYLPSRHLASSLGDIDYEAMRDLTVLSASHKIIPLGNISSLIIKGGLFCYGNERPRSEWT